MQDSEKGEEKQQGKQREEEEKKTKAAEELKQQQVIIMSINVTAIATYLFDIQIVALVITLPVKSVLHRSPYLWDACDRKEECNVHSFTLMIG